MLSTLSQTAIVISTVVWLKLTLAVYYVKRHYHASRDIFSWQFWLLQRLNWSKLTWAWLFFNPGKKYLASTKFVYSLHIFSIVQALDWHFQDCESPQKDSEIAQPKIFRCQQLSNKANRNSRMWIHLFHFYSRAQSGSKQSISLWKRSLWCVCSLA